MKINKSMDRKGTRNIRPKNLPPKDLYALGGKSASSSVSNVCRSTSGANDNIQAQISSEKSINFSKTSGSTDRGRDGPAILLPSKSKQSFAGSSGLQRHSSKTLETWESVAEVVDAEDLLSCVNSAERRVDADKIESYLCGAVKLLKNQRIKPDNVLSLTLMYLAKVKALLFRSSPLIAEAFCSVLRKNEHGLSFKTKNNPSVAVLAVNVLFAAFHNQKCWPEVFVRAFIEDSLGERLWVDHEDCKGFTENIICSFTTKLPSKFAGGESSLNPSRLDCPSSPTITGEHMDDEDASLEIKEVDDNVFNRYTHLSEEIEEIVLEAVQNQLNLRHQNVDTVARNFIRFLSVVTGVPEVRRVIAPKLETWLQNHKHQRPAMDLLMSLCLNCNSHSATDQKVIAQIVHIRIKLKPLTNQYLACLKELLAAHPDNIASVIKETIFNELSNSRNLNNMAILAVVFQYAPDTAASILADIFLELLRNGDDFLRALRALLREIIRSLRHDLQYEKFCQGLLKDQKDASFKDFFEHKERMYHSIVDLVVMTMFVSISPQIRDAANMMYRGENRDIDHVKKYQEMVSMIHQETLYWMYRIATKTYGPTKEEYIKSVHKVLMMDMPEAYYHKDNWPMEVDRPLFFRLASEVPVKQDTLQRLLYIGSMKEQYMKPQEVLELIDKLIKRATAIGSTHVNMLHVENTKIIDLIFNLCLYIPPENSPLPLNYKPPKTAISNLYWKTWVILLLITAHNPEVFGILAWENYPTLHVMMEMCITNSFQFPPPTMATAEKAEEMNNQEIMAVARERQQILEFESHLALKTITEQNSLLLSQLITFEPTGLARKPNLIMFEQIKAINASHKIGHLLCRCRKPDFLVDIIQRQGAPQSMPWLAQLVESSEDAFSILPVQCLCEFLLSETIVTSEGTITTHHQQLLQHLRCLLLSPKSGEDSSVEILDYFLRRLSSSLPEARTQAVRGLQLVVDPFTETLQADNVEPYKWLLKHLPSLPGFPLIKNGACQALRAACMIETKPAAVSAYIRFLAVHTCEDSLQDMSALVQDMAQLIVERSTMISAILPNNSTAQKPNLAATLNALFVIFINYMQGARLMSCDIINLNENQDHVRIQWASGEQAILHILVIHAMVILLIYGPFAASDYFKQLLDIWFPANLEMPQAFLVDTAEEALLLPDWLKLKMIRSTVPQLVDAALKDLEPSQLVLFIQSFGIPVASMTKLLGALDNAVRTNEEAVAAAVLDKSHKNYMAQLVEVQHQRGARSGHEFARTLGERNDFDNASESKPQFLCLLKKIKSCVLNVVKIPSSEVQSFILQCFTSRQLHVAHDKQIKSTMRALLCHVTREIAESGKNGAQFPYLSEVVNSIAAIIRSDHCPDFVVGLNEFSHLSAPLFRALYQMKDKSECAQLYSATKQIVSLVNKFRTNLGDNLNYGTQDLSIRAQGSSSKSQDSASLHHILAAICRSEDKIDTKSLKAKNMEQTLVSFKDISNQESALHKLNTCPVGNLEKVLREMVEISMKNKSVEMIVKVIVLALISKFNEQQKSGIPSQHIPVLMDWLQILDPEFSFVPFALTKSLLLGDISGNLSKSSENKNLAKCEKTNDVVEPMEIECLGPGTSISDSFPSVKTSTSQGYSQSYLLAAYTHQANWSTLENTIHELLQKPLDGLNYTALLDFVWAVLHVPKLWQGRERRTPRHSRKEIPLKLNLKEISNLTKCVINEFETNYNDEKPISFDSKRLELFFTCYNSSKIGLHEILESIDSTTKENVVVNNFMYQVYLMRPYVIRNLSNSNRKAIVKVQQSRSVQDYTDADVFVHNLITMLCNPLPGKEFSRRMQELDMALKKMASYHTILILRNLPLIAASMQGLSGLNWHVFQSKNHHEVFCMIIGVLELLKPYLFHPKYSGSLTKLLECYMEVLREHGTEIGSLVFRVCDMLMSWIGTKSKIAAGFIAKNTSIFSMLLDTYPDMLPLRSIAALAVSEGPESSSVDSDKNSTLSMKVADDFVPYWIEQRTNELLYQIEGSTTYEDQSEMLRRVFDLSDSSYGKALPAFLPFISDAILSVDQENRRKGWSLISTLLKKNPKISFRVKDAVLAALQNEEILVSSNAVKYLPKIILMLHEYSVDILSASFDVCTVADPELTNNLSEAMFLLTINTGA